MNDNKPSPPSEPEFDPHSLESKLGCLFGAIGTAAVIGLFLLLL